MGAACRTAGFYVCVSDLLSTFDIPAILVENSDETQDTTLKRYFYICTDPGVSGKGNPSGQSTPRSNLRLKHGAGKTFKTLPFLAVEVDEERAND